MNKKRIYNIIKSLIHDYRLDLSGLKIYTEAGSEYYMLTPIICALAGAEKVIAITKDSQWGDALTIQNEVLNLAELWNIKPKINFTTEKRQKDLRYCDIVTNLGFVRPIDRSTIRSLKNTAVVPLMWETWEYRPDEVDLETCKKEGIVVLGTDEHRMNFIQYAAYLDWKLLLDANIEIYKNKIFIFSSNPVARVLNEMFSKNSIDYRYVSFDDKLDSDFAHRHIDPNDKQSMLAYLKQCDAILLDEKTYDKPIIANDGVITPYELKKANDEITIIFRSGVIDLSTIQSLGFHVSPDRDVSFGYSTVCSYYLGPRPLIELHVAGLRVGEVMARSRLKGLDIQQTVKRTLREAPAVDFPGKISWLK